MCIQHIEMNNYRTRTITHLQLMEVTSKETVTAINNCVWNYKHLNFDKHISSVCSSSYFHIRALRHIRRFLTQKLPRHRSWKMVNYAQVGRSQRKLCWRSAVISDVQIDHQTWVIRGERLINTTSILCYCWFQIRLCSAFKTPWLESLLAQLPTPPQL